MQFIVQCVAYLDQHYAYENSFMFLHVMVIFNICSTLCPFYEYAKLGLFPLWS